MFPSSRPFLSLVLAAFVLPALLASASPDEAPADACVPMYVEGVGDACRRPDGHYDVRLADGSVYTTHGPDPKPADGDDDAMSALAERNPRCATDNFRHILYGRPANAPDRYGDSLNAIRSAVRRMNALLNSDALESGGVNADYKVLCDANGIFRVDSFVAPSNSIDFSAIVSAARGAGFTDSRADYTIFYDASHSSYCGVGHFSTDDRLIANNANNFGGDYGVTYRGCWTGRTPMHENGHNQGAVQTTAPDSDGSGHCLEGIDVMCYPTSSVLVLCSDRLHFDCDHDTYFDAQSEPGEWLHTHWNIGSRLNRFIAFSDTSPPPTNTAPLASFVVTLDDKNVSVDASASSDPDGDTLAYTWEFGDGETATGVTATHTYSGAGMFTISLTVTDGKGGLGTTTTAVTVRPDVAPSIVTFAFNGTIGCSVALPPIMTTDLCHPQRQAPQFPVPLEPGVTGLHVTLQWGEGAGPLGVGTANQMAYAWLNPAAIGGASGPSPVIAEHDIATDSAPHVFGVDGLVEVRPSGLSGAVVDQSFDLCVVVLYGGAVLPEDVVCG